MAFVYLTLSVILFTVVYLYLRRLYSYWERRGIPNEAPVLIFGNMKGLGTTLHIRDIFRRMYVNFKGKGPFVGAFMFMTKTAVILDLDLLKQVFIKDFSHFHDRGLFNNVRDDPLTGHLLNLEGENWRAMRTKLTAVFTSAKMRYMVPTIVEVGQKLAATCGEMLQANSEQEVELKELSARYTTDVIGTCVFGLECNSLKDPNAEFRMQGRSISEKPRHGLLVQLFLITNPKWARRLRMKLISDSVSKFFLGAVRRTVAYRIENNIKRNDFMDLLIDLKADDEELASKGKYLEHGLTIEQIAAQSFVFFVAGFETSSATMSYLLYELALHPEIQNKLRKEITDVLNKHNGEITYDSIKDMHYLEQVMLETLRKYTILSNLIRIANDDYVVPSTSQVIEKGVSVIIPVEAIHNDPEYYPDPDKFMPERFTPEAMKERHPCAFLPFGDGPRNCIGMRFGKTQAKVGVIALLQQYKFGISKNTQVPLKFSKKIPLLSTESGIHLRIERL